MRTFYIDGLNGNDSHDGLTPSTAVLTATGLVSAGLTDGDTVYYKNLRSINANLINLIISNSTWLIWDTTTPCLRCDAAHTAWTNVAGNLWKSTAAWSLPAGLSVASFFYNWDVNITTWGAHFGCLTKATSLANVTATANSWWIGDDGFGVTRAFINKTFFDNNAVTYTATFSSGVERNGFFLTGNNNYVECYGALLTESGGGGTGSDGKGGWMYNLRGDDCTLAVFQLLDFGYKAGAIVGKRATIRGLPNNVVASFTNESYMGATDNGTAAFTHQGNSEDVESGICEYLNIYCHTHLNIDGSAPVVALDKSVSIFIHHPLGSERMSGMKVRYNNIHYPFSTIQRFNHFGFDGANLIDNNLAHIPTEYDYQVYKNSVGLGFGFDYTQIGESVAFYQNYLYITRFNGTGSPIYLNSSKNKSIGVFSNVIVWNNDANGCIVGTDLKTVSINVLNNTCINVGTLESNNSIIHRAAPGTIVRAYNNIFYEPSNGGLQSRKCIFAGEVIDSGDLTLDIQNNMCVGLGGFGSSDIGSPPTLPAYSDSSGTFQATKDETFNNYFPGQALAADIFQTPLSTNAQDNSNYQLKDNAPSYLLEKNRQTYYAPRGINDVAYSGSLGAFQIATPIVHTNLKVTNQLSIKDLEMKTL